jgi:hypothetical protein
MSKAFVIRMTTEPICPQRLAVALNNWVIDNNSSPVRVGLGTLLARIGIHQSVFQQMLDGEELAYSDNQRNALLALLGKGILLDAG